MREEQASSHSASINAAQEIQTVAQKLAENIKQNQSWQASMLRDIEQATLSGAQKQGQNAGEAQIPLGSSESFARVLMGQFTTALLDNLRYQEMDDRYEDIPQAHADTLRWIFQQPGKDKDWSSFVDWLATTKTDTSYWVTGKPGSGKSTLMKFVVDAPETSQHLQVWAGSRNLLILSFYFWNSGTERQMDQEGLFRRILYTALVKHRELATTVFRDRLKTYTTLGHTATWQEPWTRLELSRLLRRLIKTATESMSVAMFIDGLDEFQGPPLELVELLRSFTGEHVKICTSSRPWPVFEDAFAQQPSLRMETLTHKDIHNYLTTKLGEHPGFQPLRELDADGANILLRDIMQKAQGVFLWVYLVVRLLTESLSNGQPLSELQCLVNSLPSELTALFNQILLSLRQDEARFRKTTELLQIAQTAIGPLRVLQYYFAEEDDPEFAFKLEVKPLTSKVEQARAELTRRRVVAYSKCLLEVKKRRYVPLARSPVEFIHRTVADYLKNSSWSTELVRSEKNFSSNLRLCLAQIAWIKTLPQEIKWASDVEQYHGSVPYIGEHVVLKSMEIGFKYAVLSDPRWQVRLIKELNHAAATLTDCEVIARRVGMDVDTDGDVDGEVIKWPCTHRCCQVNAAALYAAVQCRMVDLLEAILDGQLNVLGSECRLSYLRDLASAATRTSAAGTSTADTPTTDMPDMPRLGISRRLDKLRMKWELRMKWDNVSRESVGTMDTASAESTPFRSRIRRRPFSGKSPALEGNADIVMSLQKRIWQLSPTPNESALKNHGTKIKSMQAKLETKSPPERSVRGNEPSQSSSSRKALKKGLAKFVKTKVKKIKDVWEQSTG